MGAIQSQKTATIANGQTVSDAVYIGDKLPVTLLMPAAFTGATVSFQGSLDGATYQAVNVGGAAYSETVTASKNVTLDPSVFAGFRYVKVVSASAEAAARSVGVVARKPGV